MAVARVADSREGMPLPLSRKEKKTTRRLRSKSENKGKAINAKDAKE
jgi:hypothetical protein